MSLIEQIDQDIISAMKSQDEAKVSVLRMLKAATTNYKIASQKDLDDAAVTSVIQKEIKTRKESIEVYKKGNRPELAEKELKEVEILKNYLPEQASEEEIRAKVKEVIAQENATGIQSMGPVMGKVMAQFQGKADGSTVSAIVKEELTK